jgi:L-asparaginase II
LTVVAEVVRNGFVESVHHGRVVALDARDDIVLRVGDIDAPFFPRSAMKPLQTLGMLRAGWLPADDEQVAIACASHSGEAAHLRVVRRVLSDAGLDDAALDNTPGMPLAEGAALELIRAGEGPDRLHQNCSGKHAAMLATCVANDWPTQNYLDPTHPLQLAIRASVEDVAREQVAAVGVDGCGAPLFALSPVALARAFSRLVTGNAGTAERRVADAMRAHPFLVGGTGRDGVGIAVKIDDGAGRARSPVLVAALRRLGVTVDVSALTPADVLGHGRPVGAVRATL